MRGEENEQRARISSEALAYVKEEEKSKSKACNGK